MNPKRITITVDPETQRDISTCLAVLALEHDGAGLTISDAVREAVRRMASSAPKALR